MLFDVLNSFVGYYNVIACNVFGDDAVKFSVELADELQRLSPEKNIFVAVRIVKKIFARGICLTLNRKGYKLPANKI